MTYSLPPAIKCTCSPDAVVKSPADSGLPKMLGVRYCSACRLYYFTSLEEVVLYADLYARHDPVRVAAFREMLPQWFSNEASHAQLNSGLERPRPASEMPTIPFTLSETLVKDKRRFLKVKLKTLAAEARIIRREELRTKDHTLREALYLHRIHKVRRECRDSHLAYGFIRGREYHQLEPEHLPYYPPDWANVHRMARQYGDSATTLDDIKRWGRVLFDEISRAEKKVA